MGATLRVSAPHLTIPVLPLRPSQGAFYGHKVKTRTQVEDCREQVEDRPRKTRPHHLEIFSPPRERWINPYRGAATRAKPMIAMVLCVFRNPYRYGFEPYRRTGRKGRGVRHPSTPRFHAQPCIKLA